MTKSSTTPQINQGIAKSTYFLSLAVSTLLTAGITAVAMWFFVTNVTNEYRGNVIEDIKAVANVSKDPQQSK